MGEVTNPQASNTDETSVIEHNFPYRKRHLSTERIIGMSDNVFAVVMTLMLISAIQDLSAHSVNPSNLANTLIQLGPKIGAFLVSFFVIGTIWVTDNFVSSLKTVDIPFLWIRLLYLLLVTFMGLTSTLLGVYHLSFYAHLLFGVNMALIYMIVYFSWSYAYRNQLLMFELSANLNRAMRFRSILGVTAYSFGAVLGYWNPLLSFIYFLAVALLMALLQLVSSLQWVSDSEIASEKSHENRNGKECC